MRRRLIASLFLAAGLAAVVVPSATAGASQRGTITGRVTECAAGPIVVDPSAPSPAPVTVSVMRNGHVVASESVPMADHEPWFGTFSLSVRAGRYEVVSSYENRTAWVHVRPGATIVVNFGYFACPMLPTPIVPEPIVPAPSRT
jgi:hypothetical protein